MMFTFAMCLWMDAHVLQDEALKWQAAYKASPPTEAIVFILGGSTYEESKVCHISGSTWL